jgi:hypothetical protein
MRTRLALGLVIALAAPPVLLLTTACKAPAAPGTSLGSYTVTGTLEGNTCGAGFLPDPVIRFPVEVRRSGSTAYWSMGSGPRAEGTIDADGDFRFRYQVQIDGWPADPDNGIPACRYTQTETIEGRVVTLSSDADAGDGGGTDPTDAGGGDAGVDAGDAGPTLGFMSATSTIEIGVAPGFDCSLSLEGAGAGGQFASLPCRATYHFEGAPAE